MAETIAVGKPDHVTESYNAIDAIDGIDANDANDGYDGYDGHNANNGYNHELVWGFCGFVLSLALVMCFQFAKYLIKRRKSRDKTGHLLGGQEKTRPDVHTPDAAAEWTI